MNAVFEEKVVHMEQVKADPLDTIAGVFESIDFDYYRANCNRWFHAVIINQNHVYDEEDRRTGLQTLFVDLELLLEAVYVIYMNASETNECRRSVMYDKAY